MKVRLLSPQGAVWTMKFSHCGRLLATAGQDNVVRIWVLKTAFDYFNNMRIKYNTEGKAITDNEEGRGGGGLKLKRADGLVSGPWARSLKPLV